MLLPFLCFRYLGSDEIERPRIQPTISPLVGIQSLYSFFMLGDGVVAARAHSCWWSLFARVRGKDSFTPGFGGLLTPPGVCARANVTIWRTKPRLTSTAAVGVATEKVFIKDLWGKLRSKVAPSKFAAVQADELWSESERCQLRPGHFWMCELGDAGDGKGSIEQSFSLSGRNWKDYKGIRFSDGESALVVKRWFHRTDDDASGCTFKEMDP